MGMKRIVLHIDKLVLHNFPKGASIELSSAFKYELERVLATGNATSQLASLSNTARLTAKPVRVAPHKGSSCLGEALAHAVARKIKS